jgi:hypothetical protein
MADAFADLSKTERIEKAAAAYAADYRLTVRKDGKIYCITYITITRRLKQLIKLKKLLK